MVIVTDVRWKDEKGDPKVGYYMDGYLMQNMLPIPKFLEKGYDVVGIVSGHGKVRIGKSTIAQQVGYLIAWLCAGGKMEQDAEGKFVVTKRPTKDVGFGMDNIVFSPDELMKKAYKLPKGSVLIYDEGRAGLDSARAMENINKGMQDFFQECGVLGHIILIVLPNFFKLHEDYAVARSLFLIDVYNDENYDRGFFNFYNELNKEKLFFFGKKMVGVTAKYMQTKPNFFGRFGSWLAVDKKEYEEAKKLALAKKRKSRIERKWKKERDIALYLMKKYSGMTYEAISKEFSIILNEKVSPKTIRYAINAITHEKIGIDKDEVEEDEEDGEEDGEDILGSTENVSNTPD